MQKPDTQRRVGIWLRVSTADQAKGESPQHHEERGRQYAEVKGWKVAEVYHLEGTSGKAVMEHPEAKRMLKDIARGHIKALIFSKLSRLGRNIRELLEFADHFQKHEADLVSLAEAMDTSTPAGRFFYTVISAMAHWEREEIVERVIASVPIRAKLGKPMGGKPPFGYRWVDRKLVPNPETAPVRRLVHELYLKHKRKNAVARLLNEAGHRSQNSCPFTAAAIGFMLHDPTPKGLHPANCRTKSGGKGMRFKPEADWVYQPVEPIVTAELWDACHHLLTEQEAQSPWKPKARTPVHIFAGLTVCGLCEGKMYVPSNTPKYVCRKCRNKVSCQDLEELFITRIRRFFVSQEEIQGYLARGDEELQGKTELLAGLQKERDRISQEKDRVYRLFVEDGLTNQGFAERYRPLEDRLAQLQIELPRLEGEIDFLKVNLVSEGEVFAEGQSLADLWHGMDQAAKQRAAESLLEKIVVGDGEIDFMLSYLPELLKQRLPAGSDGTSGGAGGSEDDQDPRSTPPKPPPPRRRSSRTTLATSTACAVSENMATSVTTPKGAKSAKSGRQYKLTHGSPDSEGSPIMRRMSVIARALFACIAVPLAARALADAPGESFLVAPSGDGNLRNSEGDIVDLDGGDLLLAWSEFYGGGADEAAARIAAKVSSDQGKTWGDRFVLQENIGAQNVMSVSFLKSESGAPGAAKKGDIFFFYLKKDSNADLTVWHRRLLAREGPTSFKWTEPKSLPTDPGYHVMNNDRVIETKKGRILAPIAYTRDIGKDYNGQTVRVYFSDDGCQTWRRNKEDVALRDDSGKISPAMEPGLIELADGRLLMIIRTRLDRIFKSYSADAGETWSPAEPMALVSPAAPASIARIPTTGDLLMIWNNVAAGSKASWSQRNPLTAAVSHDDGLTWDFTRDIDTESGASFAYTSVLFSGETAILSYYRQTGKPERLDLRLRRVPIGWFYDRSVGQSDPGK